MPFLHIHFSNICMGYSNIYAIPSSFKKPIYLHKNLTILSSFWQLGVPTTLKGARDMSNLLRKSRVFLDVSRKSVNQYFHYFLTKLVPVDYTFQFHKTSFFAKIELFTSVTSWWFGIPTTLKGAKVTFDLLSKMGCFS